MLEQLPGALVSVAGSSERDIWFAGADPGDGSGALVLHYDGERFERIATGHEGDLWWVRVFSDTCAYFGGANGSILKYDGQGFSPMPTPGTDTVFGIWGMTPDELWAVGGEPSLQERAFIWHSADGNRWTEASDVPETGRSAFFKVWGRATDDFRVVGSDGVALHHDGSGFRQVDTSVVDSLTTVHVAPEGTYVAVGGFGDGLILEDSGQGWEDRTPGEPSKQLFGVWLSDTTGVAVGSNGTLLERQSGTWSAGGGELLTTLELHAVWSDPTGGVWAVGGDLVSTPKVDGVILHRRHHMPERALMP